jgi:hypothetical protein
LRALAAAIIPELETNFFMSPASNCYIPEISFFCNTAMNCNISETQLISATPIASFQRLFLQHHLQHSRDYFCNTTCNIPEIISATPLATFQR